MPNKESYKHVCLLSASVAVILAMAAPALAQEAASVDEVVVTAQKRTENVQDVPKSVAVAGQANLAAAGVSRINDLSAVFPSLSIANNAQAAKPPGIRGVVTFANAVSVQAQTGIIIDDIPQPTFSTLASELTDIERVEVFAGPQSTLSGRNAAGGIINFVTRAPSREFAANAILEQTTDRQTRGSLFVTGPLSDTVAVSVSGLYNKWDGAMKNIALGNRAQGFDSKGVRGKLRWEPTEKFSALLTGYYLQSDRVTTPIAGGGVYINVTPGATHGLDAQNPKRTFAQLYPGITPSKDNREFYSLQNGWAKTKDKGVSLRLDYDLATLGTLSSLSNYSESEQPRNDIFLGSPQTNVVPSVTAFNAYTDIQTKYWSQEVRLVSPGDQTFTYLLGAIYTDSDLFQPYARPGIFAFDSDRTSRIKSFGAFGRGTYKLTEADSLTAGLRYQHDKIGYTWKFNLGPAGAYSEDTSSYGFLAGEASFKHDFSDTVNAYVTLSHSETGRAYDIEDNATAAVKPLTPLDSEKVDNIELGVKSQWFDRRLTLNVNVYNAAYKNYQIQTIDNSNPNVAPVIRVLAIGKVRTQGVELTSTFRATDDLRLSLSAIYNDAQIRDYPRAGCYTRQTVAQGCMAATATTSANQGNLKGKSLQAAPKVKINASADYTLPFETDAVGFKVGASYRYESRSNFSILHDPATEQKPFAIVNIHAAMESKDGKYVLTAFVNNLFDKVFYNNIGNESQINARNVLYDRNSFRYGGVRLNYNF